MGDVPYDPWLLVISCNAFSYLSVIPWSSEHVLSYIPVQGLQPEDQTADPIERALSASGFSNIRLPDDKCGDDLSHREVHQYLRR